MTWVIHCLAVQTHCHWPSFTVHNLHIHTAYIHNTEALAAVHGKPVNVLAFHVHVKPS